MASDHSGGTGALRPSFSRTGAWHVGKARDDVAVTVDLPEAVGMWRS